MLDALQFNWSEAGVGRGTRARVKLNQYDGYDCSSCAGPDPDEHRSIAKFCESAAKATASNADDRACGPEVFAQHSLAELSQITDRDLNNLGRPTHPLVKRPGAAHYEPIAWPEVFALIASTLNGLALRLTRPCFIRRVRCPTSRRFCSSFLPGSTAPTTCPAAPICATRAALRP